MDKNKSDIMNILEALAQTYPDNRCELNYDTPFQLLVATILAAQATDKKVNEVTKGLFEKYKTPDDFLKLSLEELQQEIKHINFYKTKAKYILEMSSALKRQFNGEVPVNREELVKLSGVGRKTANVILSYAFGVPAIAVDTHVLRVANRLGLVKAKDVLKTELEMEKAIPEEWWSRAHSTLVLHGRRICLARKPKCEICPLCEYCDYITIITGEKTNSEK